MSEQGWNHLQVCDTPAPRPHREQPTAQRHRVTFDAYRFADLLHLAPGGRASVRHDLDGELVHLTNSDPGGIA